MDIFFINYIIIKCYYITDSKTGTYQLSGTPSCIRKTRCLMVVGRIVQIAFFVLPIVACSTAICVLRKRLNTNKVTKLLSIVLNKTAF